MALRPILLPLLLAFALPAAATDDPAEQARAARSAGDHAAAADLYARATRHDQDAGLLYDGACAAARAGRTDQAFDFLHRAVAAGWHNASHLQADGDLASLRDDPRWSDVVAGAEANAARHARLWNSPAFRTEAATPDEDQRVAGLSRLWSEAKFNFANFDLVPTLDWDAAYLAALPRVRAARTADEYYRELQAFVALLGDGHTGVHAPGALGDRQHARPGLRTSLVEGRVFVRDIVDERIRALGVAPGWEVVAIDGEAVTDYAERHLRPYIAASTEQDRLARMYEGHLLSGDLARSVRVTFRDTAGSTHVRDLPRIRMMDWYRTTRGPAFAWRMLPGDVALVTLTAFEDDAPAEAFLAAFPDIAKARAIVFDIRDHGGGNSTVGYRILATLTERPVPTSAWRTRSYRPAFRAWGAPEKQHRGTHGLIQPDPERHYAGPVLVLTSARTYSAAEDFAVAFDVMQRGRIVGEPTGGSTGQPLMFDLPGGILARVCTKRDTYPDGREFVGVGVQPQVRAAPAIADLRAGRDTVLEAALALLAPPTTASTP